MVIFKSIALFLVLNLVSIAHAFCSGNSYSLNNELLNKVDVEIRSGVYGKVTGIVVLGQSGKLLHEQYYGFTSKSTINPISSVTKSLTSLLVGICLEQGYIKSIDTPIYSYFPEYANIFKNDSLKKKITLRHLLNQTTGLAWEEWKYPYNYVSNSLIALLETNGNWVETFFKLPVETEPGLRFKYNSLASQVVAEVLSRASGMSFEELTKQYLFKPLHINTYYWDNYPNNSLPAWGGIALTTHDMAKFGMLILNDGKYSEKQIVSKKWIEESVKQSVSYTDSVGYGLHWWIGKQTNRKPLIYAAGYGDQYVYIAPDKGLVIAINSQNFSDYRWPKGVDDLVNSILSSISETSI